MLLNLVPMTLFRILAMYYIDILHFNLIDSHIFLIVLLGNVYFFSMIFLIMDKEHPISTIKRIIDAPKKDFLKLALFGFPIALFGNFLYLVSPPLVLQIFTGSTIFFNTVMSVIINENHYLLNWKIIILLVLNIISCSLPSIYHLIIGEASNITTVCVLSNILFLTVGAILNTFMEKAKETSSIVDFNHNKFSSVIFTLNTTEFLYTLLFTPLVLLIGKYNDIDVPDTLTKWITIYALGSISGFAFAFLFMVYDYYLFKLKSIELGINENLNICILAVVSVITGLDKLNPIIIISLVLTILSSLGLTYVISSVEHNEHTRTECRKTEPLKVKRINVTQNDDV